MSPLLSALGIKKSYGARVLLDGVDFFISKSEKIALVGANGSGKSTFLSLLAGLETPDEGEVIQQRDLRIGYLGQNPAFTPTYTARQEVASGLFEIQEFQKRLDAVSEKLSTRKEGDFLDKLLEEQAFLQRKLDELGGWATEHRVEEMIDALGIKEPEKPLEELSGGERKRAVLGKLLLTQPDLLLLDEPTNHLDADTVLWLEELLQGFPGGLLFVTHDRYFLDRIAERTVELFHGKFTIYNGGFEAYLTGTEERLKQETRQEEVRLNLLRTELDWLRRQPKARGSKSKARIGRAEALLDAKPSKEAKAISLGEGFRSSRQGKTILRIENLSVTLEKNPILHEVNFALRAGDRIGVIGPNGVGKSTLLKAIVGEIPTEEDAIEYGVQTKISYFAQHRDALPEESTIWDVVGEGADFVDIGENRVHLTSYLSRFLFTKETYRQKIKSLSGGEKARIDLALLLRRSSNVLLFDEPTNDLDLPTLQALEGALVEFGGSAIIVTHDRYFLDKIATAILALRPSPKGATATRYEGNYQIYRKLYQEKPSTKPAPQKVVKKKPKPVKQNRLSFAEEKELSEISVKIEKAEAVKKGLETRLSDPKLYQGAKEEIVKIQEGLEKTTRIVEALYERWTELEEKQSKEN